MQRVARRGEELDVFALGRAHAARRVAKNTGGRDADEENAFEGRIVRDNRTVHYFGRRKIWHVRIIGTPRRAAASKFGREIRPRSLRPEATSLPRAAASPQEVEVGPKQNQCPDDRQDPTGGMKLAVRRLPDQTADEAADERSANAERHRHQEAHGYRTWVEEPRQHADDEADDDRSDNRYDPHRAS